MKNRSESQQFNIRILPGGRVYKAPRGSLILEALKRADEAQQLHTPCGGKGRCGKCLIKIYAGQNAHMTETEKKLLTRSQIESGFRLACLMILEDNLTLSIPGSNESRILTERIKNDVKLSELTGKYYREISEPTLHDQRDDLERISDELKIPGIIPSLSILPGLSKRLRECGFKVTVSVSESMIVSVEKGDTSGENYCFAVDVGTTTLVVYLLDALNGRQIAVLSEQNRQGICGADVISRISHTIEHPEGLCELKEIVNIQIHRMMKELVVQNSIPCDRIYNCLITGNTTMMHLMVGIDPISIARSPYIPVLTQKLTFSVDNPIFTDFIHCTVTLLPSLSAYIGADILCGVLATGLWKEKELSLLVDIGTNGEIVLGNSKRISSCATAAGPAFEGAHIRCGTGGVKGAIQTLWVQNDKLFYTTIQDAEPAGICGSGIVDLTAILLKQGLIDKKGRFIQKEKLPEGVPEDLLSRRKKIGSQEVFVLDKDIIFTQKDLREVQLAKAAIAAGIETLLIKEDYKLEQIRSVKLAGGFGNYINIENAIHIGLLPRGLKAEISSVGNSAGTGAVMCALSKEIIDDCCGLRRVMDYLELSAESGFTRKLMDHMYFPEIQIVEMREKIGGSA